MDSLANVTHFQCPPTDDGKRFLVLSGDAIPDFELKEEEPADGTDEPAAAAAAAAATDEAESSTSTTEKPKRTKKPSAIVEEGLGEGDESFDF
jgi:hypothetical protein